MKPYGVQRTSWNDTVSFFRFPQCFPLSNSNVSKIISTVLCKTEKPLDCLLTGSTRCVRMKPYGVRCTIAPFLEQPEWPDFWNTLQRLGNCLQWTYHKTWKRKAAVRLHVLTESTCHRLQAVQNWNWRHTVSESAQSAAACSRYRASERRSRASHTRKDGVTSAAFRTSLL